MLLDVPGGNLKGGRRDVCCDDAGVRKVFSNSHGDTAAAGAQVANELRAGARSQKFNRSLDEQDAY